MCDTSFTFFFSYPACVIYNIFSHPIFPSAVAFCSYSPHAAVRRQSNNASAYRCFALFTRCFTLTLLFSPTTRVYVYIEKQQLRTDESYINTYKYQYNSPLEIGKIGISEFGNFAPVFLGYESDEELGEVEKSVDEGERQENDEEEPLVPASFTYVWQYVVEGLDTRLTLAALLGLFLVQRRRHCCWDLLPLLSLQNFKINYYISSYPYILSFSSSSCIR